MLEKTAAEKMHIKPGVRVASLHAPEDVLTLLGMTDVEPVNSPQEADIVLLFVNNQAEVEERLTPLAGQLSPATATWIIYPKGSKAAGLDISRDTIWPVAEALGMRPVSMVSVNERWSAFRVKTAG